MLYKIEFLTIENMKVKRDYEIYNCSKWQTAINKFMDHQKFYFPVYIFDIKRLMWDDPKNPHAWRTVFREEFTGDFQEDQLIKLNVDLGFLQDYNESGL